MDLRIYCIYMIVSAVNNLVHAALSGLNMIQIYARSLLSYFSKIIYFSTNYTLLSVNKLTILYTLPEQKAGAKPQIYKYII